MNGCKMHDLSHFLETRSIWKFEETKTLHSSQEVQKLSIAQITDALGLWWPSDDLLQELFLADFQTNKPKYEQHFQKVKGSVLSCDHTFKVSVNIGFAKPLNNS